MSLTAVFWLVFVATVLLIALGVTRGNARWLIALLLVALAVVGLIN